MSIVDKMANLNPNAKLKILVCDGRLSSSESARNTFGEYPYGANSATESVGKALEDMLNGNFELIRVNSMAEVLQEVSRHANPQKIPYYSLVVYASYHITNQTGGMKIHDLKNMEPFLPQMVYGDEISHENQEKAMRRGVRYCPRDAATLRKRASDIFYQPSEPLKNLTVVKIGGSAFDFTRQNKDKLNLRYAIEELTRIKNAKPKTKTQPKHQIILTVGAGQYGDISKEHVLQFPDTIEEFSYLIAKNLDTNLRLVYSHLRAIDERVNNPLQSEDFYFVDKEYARRLILMAIAPHYILAREQIPLADSDSHSVSIAELYGANRVRVVLIKRADGIYKYDPNRGFILNPINGGCADLDKWKKAQGGNKRYSEVTIDEMLHGNFSREGTGIDGNPDGSKGHLMEDSALEYMANCKHVSEISVVHIAPEEMYYPAGENQYRHIVTGEMLLVNPEKGWRGILEQNIRDAFEGRANSKIVKSK